MWPDDEKAAENTAVLSRTLKKYGRISARQNRVCPCQLILYSVDIAARGEGGDGTVGAGGGELAHGFAAAVTRDKHAGRPGAAILAGGGVARGVKLHEVGENGVIRLMPDGDE